MTREEEFLKATLSIIVALDDDMREIGLNLPTIRQKEMVLIGLATAANRNDVVMANELADYVTEAVIRRATEVNLIVDIDEEALLNHVTDGKVNIKFIRDILNEYTNPRDAFVKVRSIMIDDWPLLEMVRAGERGDGPRLTYEIMRVGKTGKNLEEMN